MPLPSAQPSVFCGGRISIEANALRRRLETELGKSTGQLITLAFAALDASLTSHRDLQKKSAPAITGAKEKSACALYRAGRSSAT